MEQLVARRAHNPKVVGSSPAPATKKSRLRLVFGFFVFKEVNLKLSDYQLITQNIDIQ
jgi:hypothetical protein